MRAQYSAPTLPDQLRDFLLRHDPGGDYNGLSPAHKMGPAPDGRGCYHVFVPDTVHDNKVEDCGQAVRGVQQPQDRNEAAPPREEVGGGKAQKIIELLVTDPLRVSKPQSIAVHPLFSRKSTLDRLSKRLGMAGIASHMMQDAPHLASSIVYWLLQHVLHTSR